MTVGRYIKTGGDAVILANLAQQRINVLHDAGEIKSLPLSCRMFNFGLGCGNDFSDALDLAVRAFGQHQCIVGAIGILLNVADQPLDIS